MSNCKKMLSKICGCLFFSIFLLSLTFFNSFAHFLLPWSQTYTPQNANSTYSFAISDCAHINSTNVSYCWETNAARELFNAEFRASISTMWGGLIVCTESEIESAHVLLKYDPVSAPSDAAAITWLLGQDSQQHIRVGGSDANIVFKQVVSTYSTLKKKQVFAHEVGHLWGIDDLYNDNDALESIYSQPHDYSVATRHDLNAMRIGLNNLWYDPGTGGVWLYQESPGIFWLRGDVDQNGNITSADSRLVMRYSSQLESLSSLQIKLADVNKDGAITAADARLIMQYSSMEITRFPADE